MFLKQEKPEVDDFEEEKKTLFLKEKFQYFNILRKYFEKVQVFNGYPCKNVTKYLAYSFVSEHSKHFILF